MKREKRVGTLIVGIVLFVAGVIFAIIAYRGGYTKSIELASSISGDEKLALQRPYAYALSVVFVSLAIIGKGIFNVVKGVVVNRKANLVTLAQAGLLAALCYIGFAVFKIDIPVGTEKTAFHFGNVFCVLAALLIGGYWGGLAGAVGMTIGDLTTAYVTSAPKTFILKLCIGLIVGFFAHKVFKISKQHSAKYITVATVVSCALGMLFNLFADPLVGYFYKMYLLGVPQEIASVFAKWGAVTTAVNAVVAVISASIIYLAMRPAMKKAGLLKEFEEDKAE